MKVKKKQKTGKILKKINDEDKETKFDNEVEKVMRSWGGARPVN